MPNLQTCVVYVPTSDDTSDERWEVVAAALRAAGVVDIRRPPPPAHSFQPRHARPEIISTMEV